ISSAIQYLSMMNYTDELSYLPNNFSMYEDFRNVFGFKIDTYEDKREEYVFLHVIETAPIHITEHDFFIQKELYSRVEMDKDAVELEKNGETYTFISNVEEVQLVGENQEEIFAYKLEDIALELLAYEDSQSITPEEATFVIENE